MQVEGDEDGTVGESEERSLTELLRRVTIAEENFAGHAGKVPEQNTRVHTTGDEMSAQGKEAFAGESSERGDRGERRVEQVSQSQRQQGAESRSARVLHATATVETLRAWRRENPDLWPSRLEDDDFDAWLHTAAKNGDEAAVQVLLNAGVNVNHADYFLRGSTPLYVAAQGGHVAVVEALLRAGADVNNAQVFGRLTPLHAAVENNAAAVVRVLLDAGADLNRTYGRVRDDYDLGDNSLYYE